MVLEKLEDIEAFKKELATYNIYKKKLKRLDEELDNIFYVETGVSGIRYDKIPTRPSEEAMSLFRLSLIEKNDKVAKERDRVYNQIKYIEETLNKLDKSTRTVIMLICIEGFTYEAIAKRVNYTTSGLYRFVNRELAKIL